MSTQPRRGLFCVPAQQSSQDIHVRPLPAVHPEDEMQNNMVATQYSGNFRAVDSPGQLQQGYARSQKNVQGVHHQQESRAGLQYSIPEDVACGSWNGRQISQDSNAGFDSSALHVSAQHRRCLGTMANDNYLRQSVANSGQQRKFSSQDVCMPFLNGSDLNSNTELQRRRQDQCSSVAASKLKTNPLLVSILTAQPSSSDDPNANIALNTRRLHWHQQAKSPLAALNWRWPGTQNPDHSDAGINDFIKHAATTFKTGEWKSLPAFDKGAWTSSASMKHSPEYPQIMRDLAAFCGECKDGVPMAVPGATQDESTEKKSSSMLKHISHVSPWLDINKSLDDIDQLPDGSRTHKQIMDKEKGETGLKPEQAVGWNGVQGFPTKPRSTASEVIDNTHKKHANRRKRKSLDEHCSETDLPLDKIQITNIVSVHANQSEWLSGKRSDEGTREASNSQTDLSIALSENKVKKLASPSESKEACLQYEDISDDDMDAQCEKLSIPISLEDPQYEDISDAEFPHEKYMTETSSPVLKPNDEQLPCSDDHGHVQGQVSMTTEVLSHAEPISTRMVSTKTPEVANHCSCSGFVGTNYCFENVICTKCNSMTQTNHTVSHGHSLDLKYEAETDDEMDYDCLLISILDLKFEPEDEAQDSPETNMESVETEDQERSSPNPKPVLAIDFPQIPEYETNESFIQAVQYRGGRRSTPEHVMEGVQNRRESVDNSDTEDSCDYSSASENNYLTVSRQLLQKLAPQASKMDVPSCKDDEVANAQKGQSKTTDRLDRLQKLKKMPKVGSCKRVQPKTNRQQISKNNQEIIIIPGSEDESEQSFRRKAKGKKKKKKKKKKGFFSSDSDASEDAPCSQQERLSSGLMDSQRGTVEGRFQEDGRPSADSPAPHDTLSEEVMEDKCSDPSHRTEKSNAAPKQDEHVIVIDSDTEDSDTEDKENFSSSHSDCDFIPCVESEDTENEAPGETTPSSANDGKITPSSGTEDSSDDLFDTKNKSAVDDLCGAKNYRLSSEDSPETQSVAMEAESMNVPNPVIPRLIVVKPSPPQKNVILLKEHRLGKVGSLAPQTSVTSRKKTPGLCEKNKTDSRRINMAKDGHSATKNNVQADIPKPRKLSRQLSLPGQEGPCTSSLHSTSGQISEVRQRSLLRSLSVSGETSASCSRPTSMQSPSIPRHLPESKLKRPHSYMASTSSSAPMHSEARQQILKDWESNHVPTRWEKKNSLGMGASRPQTGLCREGRPGPSHHEKAPRKRHNSQKSETPLMKKTKVVAIQRTKDISRDASKERSCSVGDGYKWSEKPAMAKPTKGSSQERRKSRSPPWS